MWNIYLRYSCWVCGCCYGSLAPNISQVWLHEKVFCFLSISVAQHFRRCRQQQCVYMCVQERGIDDMVNGHLIVHLIVFFCYVHSFLYLLQLGK